MDKIKLLDLSLIRIVRLSKDNIYFIDMRKNYNTVKKLNIM
jgi:hypothetical protein